MSPSAVNWHRPSPGLPRPPPAEWRTQSECLAGLFEIGWALAMKQSQGFTRPLPTLLMLAGMVASFGLLALAMRDLPLGTAYAIWTGIGAVGTLAVGSIFLGEILTLERAIAALLIVAGMITMKLSSP